MSIEIFRGLSEKYKNKYMRRIETRLVIEKVSISLSGLHKELWRTDVIWPLFIEKTNERGHIMVCLLFLYYFLFSFRLYFDSRLYILFSSLTSNTNCSLRNPSEI